MNQNRPTPGWGKAIGILMIVFGSLGVFIQFYKIMIPSIAGVTNRVMDISTNNAAFRTPQEREMAELMMDNFWELSPLQSNAMLFGGILGLIGCAVYIIAGAKLLKAQPSNFFLARNVLFGFIGLNVITAILMFMDDFSFILLGVLVYMVLGFVIDLVLVLVLVNSDKTKYGIGVDESMHVYTDGGNTEIL